MTRCVGLYCARVLRLSGQGGEQDGLDGKNVDQLPGGGARGFKHVKHQLAGAVAVRGAIDATAQYRAITEQT